MKRTMFKKLGFLLFFVCIVLNPLSFSSADDLSKVFINQNNLEKWKHMAPEEKKIIRERYKIFQSLNREERKKLVRNFKLFRKLPEKKRQKIKRIWNQFKKLPPGKRNKIRGKIDRWNKMSKKEKHFFINKIKKTKPPQFSPGKNRNKNIKQKKYPSHRKRNLMKRINIIKKKKR